jgi:hypothetical protein
MVKRNGAFTRSERIHAIRKFILDLKEPADFKKTIAVLQLKYGLTDQKVREYLQIITELDGIIIDEEKNLIIPPKNSE